MKKLLLLLLLPLLCACHRSENRVNTDEDIRKFFDCSGETEFRLNKAFAYREAYCVGKDGKNGPWKKWNAEGYLIHEGHFTSDIPTGHWIQRNDRAGIMLEGDNVHGNRHGLWTEYFADGSVRSIKNYESGKLHGKAIFYYNNGQVMAEGNNVDDREQGLWKVWTPDGKLARECDITADGKENCTVHIKEFDMTTLR